MWLRLLILILISVSVVRAQIPAKDYSIEMLAGWTVMVSPELLNEDKQEADSALSHLLIELIEIEEVLPDDAIAQLKGMPIWLEYKTSNKVPIQFHHSKEWLQRNKYIPEKVNSVEIVADEYIDVQYSDEFRLMSTMIGSYYRRVVGDSNAIVRYAYENARVLPIYNDEHWGIKLKDAEEYFVVASRAFYTSNWAEPVDRENLREVDSVGYEMVRVLWKDGGKVYALPAEHRYVETEVLGWKLAVDTQLIDRDTSLLKTALALIGKELNEINYNIPASALKVIREAKIYVVKFEGGSHSGRYWPKANTGSRSPTIKRRSGNLEVIAGRYIDAIRIRRKSLLLHELAHAYHDRLASAEHKLIYQTYDRAMSEGLYRGRYARTNSHEYFAELTTMYFGKNTYFPVDRFDLRGYDPKGYRMIENLWGVEAK